MEIVPRSQYYRPVRARQLWREAERLDRCSRLLVGLAVSGWAGGLLFMCSAGSTRLSELLWTLCRQAGVDTEILLGLPVLAVIAPMPLIRLAERASRRADQRRHQAAALERDHEIRSGPPSAAATPLGRSGSPPAP